MREHLLKVEEEIKNLNRGRSTLKLAIQDVRKSLSINSSSLLAYNRRKAAKEKRYMEEERERERRERERDKDDRSNAYYNNCAY